MDDTPLTRSQVARRLGLSAERVRQLTLTGKLRCRPTPLGRLYDPRDVDAYAARRTLKIARSGEEHVDD